MPGRTIESCSREIKEYINEKNPIVISVNFVPNEITCDYYFFANTIHWEKVCDEVNHNNCILSSNIHEEINGVLLVDYSSLISEDSVLYDNSTIMLLNLLKKFNVSQVNLAGFDGLKENEENYVDAGYPDVNNVMTIKETNKEVKKLYEKYKNKVTGKIDVDILTPSIYKK